MLSENVVLRFKRDNWLVSQNEGVFQWKNINFQMYLKNIYHYYEIDEDRLLTIVKLNKSNPELELKYSVDDETLFSLLGMDYERCLLFNLVKDVYKEVRKHKIKCNMHEILNVLDYAYKLELDEDSIYPALANWR